MININAVTCNLFIYIISNFKIKSSYSVFQRTFGLLNLEGSPQIPSDGYYHIAQVLGDSLVWQFTHRSKIPLTLHMSEWGNVNGNDLCLNHNNPFDDSNL